VAERAFMEFELRFWDRELMDRTVERIRREVLEPGVDGIALELEETSRIPPWHPDTGTRRALDTARRVAREMGREIAEEKRGGISDSNWVASAGVSAIDGFGPVGQGDCTREEHILLESLSERIEMAVRFLVALQGAHT
jgi:glutamate carboxypeptidase